jgi:hypothetical protein
MPLREALSRAPFVRAAADTPLEALREQLAAAERERARFEHSIENVDFGARTSNSINDRLVLG